MRNCCCDSGDNAASVATETEADADAEEEQKLLELTECGGSVHGVWGLSAVEGCSDAAWPTGCL